MISERLTGKFKIIVSIVIIGILIGLTYCYGDLLRDYLFRYYTLFTDNDRITSFIASFGIGGPVVFILLQILQVLFAPIPGEASGIIGGYLFGTIPGFFYSTIGLSVGSWLNLVIGRSLGKRFVRKLISPQRLERFDRILKRQGVIVFFILFIFPGFPKDYLCFFLGLSAVPLNVLFIIAAVGRMPGTFLLSLQGAYLFDENYGLLLLVVALCLIIGLLSYRHKQQIYKWVEKYNGR